MESVGGSHLCFTEMPCLFWDEAVTTLSSFGHIFPMQIPWRWLWNGERKQNTHSLLEAGPPNTGKRNAPFMAQNATHRAGDWEETAASSSSHILSRAPLLSPAWSSIACLVILFLTYMDWLLSLLLPGALLILCWSSAEGESQDREAKEAV